MIPDTDRGACVAEVGVIESVTLIDALSPIKGVVIGVVGGSDSVEILVVPVVVGGSAVAIDKSMKRTKQLFVCVVREKIYRLDKPFIKRNPLFSYLQQL